MLFEKGNQINKGRTPWNKGKKGCFSKETVEKTWSGKNNPMYGRTGSKNPNWNGGRYICPSGYVRKYVGSWKRGLEHRLIAEKALGRKLKSNEIVHHINGDKADNRNCNLLICERGYHGWLHERMANLYMKEHFGGV